MITFDDIVSHLEQTQNYERYVAALCPFHDDKQPSLMVYKDGWFRCLGCGRNGRWDVLWGKLRGQPVQVRPDIRPSWNGPDTKGYSNEEIAYIANEDLMKYPSLGWYLQMRGVDSLAEVCQLGYWHGWYTIPIYTREGGFVNTFYRAAPHVQEVSGMRHYYKGRAALYCPDWRRVNASKYVFLVYGMFDALTLAAMGLPVVTFTMGDRSFDPFALHDIRKPIIVVPDRDAEKLAAEHVNKLDWRGKLLCLEYGNEMKDPNDLFYKGRKEYLHTALVNAT